jgi:hypothetical protein
MTQHRPTTGLRRLSTPRAAALAGVLFAVLFGLAIALIRSALPEGATPGSQWLDAGSTQLKVASLLIPFAGIAFLWFIGVVRDGFGRYEDKFFASVFLGSGILFLAMTFVAAGLAAGLVASSAVLDKSADPSDVAPLAQVVIIALFKTYAIRMAAVFMISLATIWLKTGLMPKWLVGTTYVVAVSLLIGSDISMWVVLAFPAWVLVVSLLALVRAGVIDLHHHDEPAGRDAPRRS